MNISFVYDSPDPTPIFERYSCDFSLKWIKLKELLLCYNINLIDFRDVNTTMPQCELHLNAQKSLSPLPKLCLLLENPDIYPANSKQSLLAQYSKIFTWRKDLTSKPNIEKIFIPYYFPEDANNIVDKDIHISMIAANKSSNIVFDSHCLYRERVKVIRWFEKNSPSSFRLYGYGWNKRQAWPSKFGRYLSSNILNNSNKVFFPSWYGSIENKKNILARSTFSFTYENTNKYDNYLTEKMYDSLYCGSIPIYNGCPNINELIPETCFIDSRNFATVDNLCKYLIQCPASTINKYRNNIRTFLYKQVYANWSLEKLALTLSDSLKRIPL